MQLENVITRLQTYKMQILSGAMATIKFLNIIIMFLKCH